MPLNSVRVITADPRYITLIGNAVKFGSEGFNNFEGFDTNEFFYFVVNNNYIPKETKNKINLIFLKNNLIILITLIQK